MSRRSKRKGLTPARPWRLALSTGAALALAALLALQAASSALTALRPGTAVQFFPLNGLAAERLAYNEFLGRIESEADLVPSARKASSIARNAVRQDPLTPKAHGLLALAETDPARRAAILAAATKLNRRDLFTQGLVLDRFARERDFGPALATLDRLLRVHPNRQPYFFTVLAKALEDDRTLPAFAEVLDGSSDWHAAFLIKMAGNPAVLDNLVHLRGWLKMDSDEFDRRLIRALAQGGDYARAYAIYRDATGRAMDAGGGSISWVSAYAPFDWRLASEPDLRGTAAPEDDELEIFVRSGSGGIIAQRVIAADPDGFVVALDHSIGPPDQIRDVRLQLRCNSVQQPFFDERFKMGPNRFRVEAVPTDCGYINLAIYARAWSGRSHLRGTIEEIDIRSVDP